LHSFPFKLEVNDFSELEGLLHFDKKELHLEFVQADSILGVFKSKAKELVLPLSRISYVQHDKGWFGDKFIIQAKTIKDCEGMPGAKAGKFKLSVKKRDRKIIEDFALDLNLALSQSKLDLLGE